MITINPLSQRDPAWASTKLGFSNKTIGTHGCTLTCLSMLLQSVGYAGLRPDVLNDQLKRANAFAQGNLIVWARVAAIYPKLQWMWRGYAYDNTVVKNSILKGVPVPIEVNGQKIGATKHWVLYLGDQKMVDPWFGDIKPTSFYPPTGFALYKLKP